MLQCCELENLARTYSENWCIRLAVDRGIHFPFTAYYDAAGRRRFAQALEERRGKDQPREWRRCGVAGF